MQALEHAEEFVRVARIETHAVVANENNVFSLTGAAAHFDAGGFARAGVFESVAEEIDKDLANQRRVGFDFRQLRNEPFDFPIAILWLEVCNDILHEVCKGEPGFV